MHICGQNTRWVQFGPKKWTVRNEASICLKHSAMSIITSQMILLIIIYNSYIFIYFLYFWLLVFETFHFSKRNIIAACWPRFPPGPCTQYHAWAGGSTGEGDPLTQDDDTVDTRKQTWKSWKRPNGYPCPNDVPILAFDSICDFQYLCLFAKW